MSALPNSRSTFGVIGAVEITPDDDVDLEKATRGIYVGVAGNLKVTLLNGDTVTYVNLAAGVTHAKQIVRVWDTGTTATNIIGEY